MKAYVLKTGTRILPFDEDVGEAAVGNVRLADWQSRILRDHGFEVVPIDRLEEATETPCLLVQDKLFFSHWALRHFLKKARVAGRSVGAAMPEGGYTAFTRACQEYPARDDATAEAKIVPYALWYLTERPTEALLRSVASIVITIEDRPLAMGDIDYMGVANLATPSFNFAALLHMEHWVHIWMANLFAIPLEWIRLLFRTTTWSAWMRVGLVNWLKIVPRILWGAVRGLTLDPYKIFWNVFGGFNVMGKKCNIHPTAVVEGSILGDRVKVGPFCIVQASILGDDVKIAGQTVVAASVMGRKSTTSTQGIFAASMCYEEAMTGRAQLVVQGRRSFMAGLSRFFDTKLGEEVKVEHKGKIVGSGLAFLGGAVGHRARIGAGVWLGTARSVPNDYKVILDPQHTISTIPTDLDPKAFHTVDHGVLTPLQDIPWVKAAAERKRKKKEGGA